MCPSSEKPSGRASAKLSAAILTSVITLWILCTKHATKTSRKLVTNSSPKKLMTTISQKAIQFRQKKKVNDGETAANNSEESGGVWQRTILMGDKCQPLDFSGVIYYDSDGNKLSEVPMRSPRASPLPSYAYNSEIDRSRLGW
ncbi:uncharacterized protein LOC141714849 [Apium graveolens]|uniref:uncharacterized protein LOC141714849 n=1 Tax=Apium graveolens TaxID=4045 RepID=UPI003D7A0BDB